MKILYSHRTKSADGQYVHIRELTDALARENHDILLCGPEGIIPKSEEEARLLDAAEGESKGLADFLPKPLYELAECIYSVPAFFKLLRAHRQSQPRVIYERYNLFFLAGLWLKKVTGKPFILEVNAPLRKERETHGGLSLSSLANVTERAVWRAADAVLPVTRVLANDIVAAGVPEERITIIPNGVTEPFLIDVDAFVVRERLGLASATILGFTGFVRDWHGVDGVLDFMASHERKDLHLLLIGDGPHVPALQEQAERLGMADRFTVTGVVQRDEIPEYVAAFDIALQPRVTAYASPLKLFEYMALRCAILAPATPNIKEVLVNNENSLLFEPEDNESMAAALNLLLEDKALRQRLGDAARKTIEERDMTWDGNARKVAALAEKLS